MGSGKFVPSAALAARYAWSSLVERGSMSPIDHLELVVDVVAAYVRENSVSPSELIALIHNVDRTLQGLAAGPQSVPKPIPAAPIAESVTPDFIISLEDGRRLKSLKRHLRSLGMTPAQYRQKWGLPPGYPIVAPNFSALRSQAAKKIGLGRRTSHRPKQ